MYYIRQFPRPWLLLFSLWQGDGCIRHHTTIEYGGEGVYMEGHCHDTTKPLSIISILVNLILSWTPRGTTRLPRGTAQIALLSIEIYFLFSAFFVSDRRNWLPT